jgi:hypothetical protein
MDPLFSSFGGGIERGEGLARTGCEVFDGGLERGGDFYGIIGAGVGVLGAPYGRDLENFSQIKV